MTVKQRGSWGRKSLSGVQVQSHIRNFIPQTLQWVVFVDGRFAGFIGF